MEITIYHFVGIKGTGMSALALILHDLGYQVEGSDIDKHTFTQEGLEQAGIKITPFSSDNIHPQMTIIAGNAFGPDNSELKRAHELGLTILSYPEMVEKLIQHYTSIGVAGAHGKTSTTGLLAHVLSGIDKTSYLIGDGTGKGIKDSKFFVFEADEYRRHFLAYHPDYLIITNIDFDHPDYFKDFDDVVAAFQTEANQVKKALFVWGDDPALQQLSTQNEVPIYYYGLSDQNDFQAINIERNTQGSSFEVLHHGQTLGRFTIPLFGEHNVLNSLAVIGISYLEKIKPELTQQELSTFNGVKRRYSEKQIGDMILIDDYAHHPSEIKATLDAARQQYPDKQLIAVFQPHTYSRTKALLNGFAQSLDLADQVYLTNIFGSIREQQGQISSADLGNKIVHGGQVITLDDLSPLLQYHNGVIIFMGAGDVQKYEVAYQQKLLAKN
ncbi:UDP-N-acetylmuramate--L-alanine ligase [Bombilactobacillus bombi]|uniref:UDP-N-acetylmuramate--L-alanine ligase n=1 Tax=Bombilactobacillus bombi TaxID=1303590 RepID=A0A417ZCH3_9LACO|nr:UDP-N-acetylmuramate--L-alanine ligase [Bombilactobacillus bombi]RHW48392.1 UDP-N-acetylmuramate--L-alanine ligase [Bombilactobacillus bombi]RHW49572.1 UDP-N-acetylmuramate--L-alanine ligase [Bombilactobacillus bombi]